MQGSNNLKEINIKKALKTTFSHHVKLVQANRSSKLLIEFLYKRLNAASSDDCTKYLELIENTRLEEMLENLKKILSAYYKDDSMPDNMSKIINNIDNAKEENEKFNLLKEGFDALNELENNNILYNRLFIEKKIQQKFDQIRDYMLNGNPSEDFAGLDTNPSPSE